MSSQRSRLFLIALSILAIQVVAQAALQEEIPRSIISDDFVKNRRKGKAKPRSLLYRLTSPTRKRQANESDSDLWQVGVTIWKLQREPSRQLERVSRRVEADTKFHEGDLLRISIESPLTGYLYIVDRDWFTNGSGGETKLIFPVRGENNRLKPGKLIDIPTESDASFKATPKPNQVGEMLTIIVTSLPLQLPLSNDPLPITSTQLSDWEKRWSAITDRYEMNDGVGQTRTIEEQQAAVIGGTRQLTRDDPSPQTIFRLVRKNRDGVLFNLMLSYVQ
jgi:hypothetical protein